MSMELVILDEDQNEITRFVLQGNNNVILNKVSNVKDIDEKTKILLNNMNYGVNVYSYDESVDDFYVSYLNNKTLEYNNTKLEDHLGEYVSGLYSTFDKKMFILNSMKEVYDTGKIKKFIFEYFKKGIIIQKVYVKIFKVDDFIYFFKEDETAFVFLSKDEEFLFDNDLTGIAVIQNHRFVKVNKKYLDLCELDSYDDVVGKELGYDGLMDDSQDFVHDIIDNVTNGSLFSYSFPFEVKKDGELFHYFNINCTHIMYEGKSAVMLVYNDITEQEINKREVEKKTKEALVLQENMDLIQSVSDTCSAYIIDGQHIRSKKFYDIIERDPIGSDSKMDILEKIVISEDKHILRENYAKLSSENDSVDFIIRIITAKGHLKYIHCYINYKYVNNDRIDVISFYQDVTTEQLYLKKLQSALNESLKLRNRLETVINDKNILLSEVHHRVKNNLQIILSLINLNRNYQIDSDTILDDTENRIYAMALIHEKIYGSTSLSDVDMKNYIGDLVNSLFDTYLVNINFHNHADSIDLDMELAIPLGLIVNELVTNVIKHAFSSNEEGNLYIDFSKEDNMYKLVVKDDGVGLPDDFDLNDLSSLGLIVVQNLVLQMDGTLTILDCDGTGFKVEFGIE